MLRVIEIDMFVMRSRLYVHIVMDFECVYLDVHV